MNSDTLAFKVLRCGIRFVEKQKDERIAFASFSFLVSGRTNLVPSSPTIHKRNGKEHSRLMHRWQKATDFEIWQL